MNRLILLHSDYLKIVIETEPNIMATKSDTHVT